MNKIITYIKTSPERIILGGLILLVIIVAYKTIYKSEDHTIKNLNSNLNKFKELLATSPRIDLPEVDYFKEIKQKWESQDLPTEGNNWLMYYHPIYEVEFKQPPPPPPKKTLFPPELQPAQIDPKIPDKVVLTWKKTPLPGEATPSGYQIYRKAKTDRDFVPLLKLDKTTITPTDQTIVYEDTNLIHPETEYSYFVTTLTEDTDVEGNKNESKPSNIVKIVTPSIIDIEPVYVNENKEVWTKVHKYIAGEWKSSPGHLVKKGDRVGEGKFLTNYILHELEEIEILKPMGAGLPPMKLKGWKLFFRDKDNPEKVIIKEIKPR